jgi:hypothetical protein
MPGKASVVVYEGKNDEGEIRLQVDLVSGGMAPWTFEGYEGTVVQGPLDPGGGAPRMVFVTTAHCPGGVCAGGCGGGSEESVLEWRDGLWWTTASVFDLAPSFADHDRDGEKEFLVSLGNLDLGTCDGRWCCHVLGFFRIDGLVGWDGSRWRPDLARFRGFYEQQRGKNRSALEQGLDASAEGAKCERMSAAIREALLARILDGDEASIRASLDRAASGVELSDCMPKEDDLPWKDIMVKWEDLQEELFSVKLPRLL